VLAVEKCLVKRLPDVLSPKTIMHLDDATVTQIAAETEELRLERSRAMQKLKVLESALVLLRGLDRHKVVGQFVFFFPCHLIAEPEFYLYSENPRSSPKIKSIRLVGGER
jgi:hypothetical protein